MIKLIKERNKKYIIDEKRDLIIYNKTKILEKKKLNKKDMDTLRLIKTQLEGDWRKYLIIYLNKLQAKYQK